VHGGSGGGGPDRPPPCAKLRHVGVRTAPAALLLAALALLTSACGASRTHVSAPSPGAVATAFRGAPVPLAELHAQADQLLAGGTAAFKARLAALRGYPVVINKWASWCGPCQVEFPSFQRATLAFARRVAFVGLDGKDADAAASSFLRRFPVAYPSYTDPNESIARSIQAATYYPQTVYVDRQGKIVYDHAGPYLNAAGLETDIRRYALGGT